MMQKAKHCLEFTDIDYSQPNQAVRDGDVDINASSNITTTLKTGTKKTAQT